LPTRALQPLESSILVPAIRVDFGDLVGPRIGKALCQPGECGVCFRDSFLAPAGECHDVEPGILGRIVLRSGYGLIKLALEEEGETETGMGPWRRRI
jgi:hypothetical protein